jgi:hypothetical protein
MNCKYCHLNNHIIDKCPTIICKNCKEIGHPQWLCKDKKKNKVVEKKNIEEIKKIPEEDVNKKNLNFYLKLENIDWADLINF